MLDLSGKIIDLYLTVAERFEGKEDRSMIMKSKSRPKQVLRFE
jgi:hypothetical protein